MLFNGKNFKDSLHAGAGAFLGFLCGGLLKFIIGAILTGSFVWLVVSNWLSS
jgi:TM2 domain-containing membrane protein YozV